MESRRWMLETRFRRQKTDGINAPTGGRSLVFVVVVIVVVAIVVGCIVLFLIQLPCLAGICYGLPFSLAEIFRVLMLNELLIFLADGDLGVNLGHDSFDLILCKSQIGIDLLLVNFVSLWKREHRNETEDKQRESVEPSANVSHNPEEDSEFDGVDHVFNEDEAAEFADVGGHVRRDDFRVFLGLL